MHLHKHPRKDTPFHICGKKDTPYYVFRCMYESVLSCTLRAHSHLRLGEIARPIATGNQETTQNE